MRVGRPREHHKAKFIGWRDTLNSPIEFFELDNKGKLTCKGPILPHHIRSLATVPILQPSVSEMTFDTEKPGPSSSLPSDVVERSAVEFFETWNCDLEFDSSPFDWP
jgi:hypothetical protein